MRISENWPPVLAPWCYCRAQKSGRGKYRGNNGIATESGPGSGAGLVSTGILQVFDERVANIRAVVVGNARGLPLHIFHESIEIVARVGDANHADGGAIPQAAGIEFGDRDVEAGAQAVFHTAQHLPLVLERLRRFDVEFQGKKRDRHSVLGSQLSVLSRNAESRTEKRELRPS